SDGTLTSEYNYELEKIIKNESDFAALKELEKEQTSQVIETETGFSIFFVTAEKIMPDFNDTSLIGDVYNYLTSYEFGHIEDYYTNRANDFIATANASTFASACSSLNVEHQRLDAFPLNYGSAPIASSLDTSAKGLSGADINEHFLKTAFSLSENELSSPIVNGKSLLVLQYLYEQDASDSETSDSSNLSQEISSFDSYSVSQKIKSSPKLENNVLNVFLNHLLPTNE
ncbi:MAG: hypothetical protein IKI31_07550, partial [Treponema sp.]|nr:hypothetical protein [Treponema sp.]